MIYQYTTMSYTGNKSIKYRNFTEGILVLMNKSIYIYWTTLYNSTDIINDIYQSITSTIHKLKYIVAKIILNICIFLII